MKVTAALAEMNGFPFAQIETIAGDRRPLILVPHADDESLACGGFIAECCRQGRQPLVVILTDGAASHPGSKRYPPSRLRELRAAEAYEATSRLGLAPKNLLLLDHPDTALSSESSVWQPIVRLAEKHNCSLIVAPWLCDPHCDHEAAAFIGKSVACELDCPLLSYPVWGWLLPPEQDLPLMKLRGWRVQIADHLIAKQHAIAAHASQYSDLIDDSPNGFRLPQTLLAVFNRPFEVFLAND
jgi:LmbE family N-acetylglucosaminyl deacetylase